MSKIQWTDVTDNPIHLIKPDGKHGGHWCKKISPGCANCYAEAQNQKPFYGWASMRPYTGNRPTLFLLNLDILNSWSRQRAPKKHFVCSMTDLFGDWVATEWQFEIFDAMVAAPKQTFQVLTKRPQIALKSIEEYCQINGLEKLPSNIWVGVSVESQQYADERIPVLFQVPAHIRFLSVEPLLEQVFLPLENISWVIVGGESGSHARLCRVEWIQSVVNQCQKSGVPVFVKQLGARSSITLQDSKGGDISEFPKSLQVRNFPKLKVEV